MWNKVIDYQSWASSCGLLSRDIPNSQALLQCLSSEYLDEPEAWLTGLGL